MPDIQLLTQKEAEALLRPQTRIDLDMYMDFLQSIQPGEWKAVRPSENEGVSLVKRRLTKAAGMLQKTLRYKPPLDDGRVPVTVVG